MKKKHPKRNVMNKRALRTQNLGKPVFGFIDEFPWEEAGAMGEPKPPSNQGLSEYMADSWEEDWIFGGGWGPHHEMPTPMEVDKKRKGDGKKKKFSPYAESSEPTSRLDEVEWPDFSELAADDWDSQSDMEECPPGFDELSQIRLSQRSKKTKARRGKARS
ncbi:hypothetical protein ADL26_10925 [Thermoactinomyces vulgaris]|jgi:hypothetical protein|nr:hypothetical protein ADL26_10925 [Thermoactinomyces vulgaris]